ncbi:MAG: hypothetical protein AAFY60_18545 [Myxococcota bacterium]
MPNAAEANKRAVENGGARGSDKAHSVANQLHADTVDRGGQPNVIQAGLPGTMGAMQAPRGTGRGGARLAHEGHLGSRAADVFGEGSAIAEGVRNPTGAAGRSLEIAVEKLAAAFDSGFGDALQDPNGGEMRTL